jgi:hypothetical protein
MADDGIDIKTASRNASADLDKPEMVASNV